MRHALARGAKVQVGEPVIGLTQRALPLLHEPLVQSRGTAAQCVDDLRRNPADRDVAQGNRLAAVTRGGERLQTGNVARAQHAHDALATIGRDANQLDHARTQGEDGRGPSTLREQGGTCLEFQVVDRRMDLAEILLIEVRKQHHVADAAVAAVRGALPCRFGLDGNHGLPDTVTLRLPVSSVCAK